MSRPLDIGNNQHSGFAIGRCVSSASGRMNTVACVDAEGRSGQNHRISIAGAENVSLYEVRFQAEGLDVTVGYTTDGSATPEELRDGLYDAISADPILGAYLDQLTKGTDLLDVDSRKGVDLTLTFPANPTTDLSVVKTAEGSGPQYLYGQAVEILAATISAGKLTPSYGMRRPNSVAGQILDVTIVHDADDTYTVTGTLDGVPNVFTFAAGAAAGDTDNNAKAAMEAAVPGSLATIVATGDIDWTMPPGAVWNTITAVSDDAGTVALALNTAGAEVPFYGLVVDDMATPTFGTATGQTDVVGPLPGSPGLVASKSGSTVWAVQFPTGETITRGGTVYVEADTGSADRGLLFADPSQTRVPWAGAEWVGADPNDATIAHIRL